MNIQHMEPIGWYHYAHSFVRGNWRNENESGFCLLTKSCHDIDLLHFYMQGSKCLSISSFGSLSHFRKERKPKGAGSRCTDCSVEESCPYSAKKMYMSNPTPTGFAFVVCDVPTPENLLEALAHGPYGRCVYESDNDVIDNQVVNMYYEGGKTVSFSMVAFTKLMCKRQMKIFGTKGELTANEGENIVVFDFNTEKTTVYERQTPQELTTMRGHGFADYYLMRKFVKAVALNDPAQILSGPDDTLESHRLVFLAEKARKENRVIQVHEPDEV